MRKALKTGLGIVALTAVFAVVEVSTAKADGFFGTFRGPHGQFSIHIGSPSYPVGSYAPYGHRVYRHSRYGYGFDSPAFYCRSHRIRHAHWVPVRRHHSRWVVIERPIVIVDDDYYGRGYRDDDRYYRRGDRYDGRRYRDRYDRYDRRYDDDRHKGRRYKERRYRDRDWRD